MKVKDRILSLRAEAWEFAPAILRVEQELPSPLPRLILYTLLALFAVALLWAAFGRLDIIAVAQGKLVPQSFLKIVQPAESGIVKEILVSEGDSVTAGQVLVRMDTRLSEADGRTLLAELQRKRLQLRRIEAELTGKPLKLLADDPEDMFAQTALQFQARRQAYLDALGAEQATLIKAQHDLKAAAEIEGKLQKTVPIYKDYAESWDRLAKEGFAGRLLALERQRTYLESEQELRAQTENVASLKALIAQSEKRISQITSNYRQQLQNERVEAEALYHKLQQDWDKQEYRHALLELKAPQAGIVKDLATHTPGTVVAPGTILLTLVPHDEPLIAEVWVSNADAGFVVTEQKARVKLVAYPFQKYGMLEGEVKHISPDATDRADAVQDRKSADPSLPHQGYRTLVALKAPYLERDGRQYKLSPGMQVSAELNLGSRTVLEYLLSPVQKTVAEAARER
ncbi:MAG: HlyD family type I secretion periplasmic adaptor subunit [Burkholderiales bacterium]